MDNTRAQGIRTAFEIMQQKFNRSQSILKEVSGDTIIDFMYGFPPMNDAGGGTAGQSAGHTVQRQGTAMGGPPPLQSIQNSRANMGATINSLHGQVFNTYFMKIAGNPA